MNNPLYINQILIYPIEGKCNVEFRQGLNIIYSKNIENGNEIKIRNSVGKTTFIKLIDYMLGKSNFAKDNNDNKEFFNKKEIIAELSFYNEKFTILRSVLDTDTVTVYDGWITKKILDKDYKDTNKKVYDLKGYIEFLNEKIYKNTNIINGKRYVSHRSIMSYLIRDQFDGFKKYNSGIKEEYAKTREKRLEFLLGLVNPEIEDLKNTISELQKEKSELDKNRRIINNYFVNVYGSKKDINSNIKEIGKQLELLHNKLEKNKMNSDTEKEYQLKKDEKIKLTYELEAKEDEIEILLYKGESYRLTVNDIKNEIHKLSQIGTSIDIFGPYNIMRCPYLLKDLKHHCEYIEWDKDNEETIKMLDARKNILLYEEKDLNRAISRNIHSIEEKQIKIEQIKNRIQDLNLELTNLEYEIDVYLKDIRDEIKELEITKNLLEIELNNYNHIETLKDLANDKKDLINNNKERLELLSKSIDEFTEIYNKIIKFLTDESRIGVINKKNYSPHILYTNNNKDDGAAMKNLAIIAFDLALLELSLVNSEVSKYFPRFIIHDSPRNNDLQDDIYFRVFEYIIKLEKVYFPQHIYFQYIITTLDYPSKLISDKYIVLELDNSGEGGKLFGRNIEV